MSQFMIIKEMLEEKLGKEEAAQAISYARQTR